MIIQKKDKLTVISLEFGSLRIYDMHSKAVMEFLENRKK